jgi:hypothetical protein
MGDLRANHGNHQRMTSDVNIFLALAASISDRQGVKCLFLALRMYISVLE